MSLTPYLSSGYSKHDGLPPGQWVIDRRTRVLRYEIDHEAAAKAAAQVQERPADWVKTCPCGEPPHSPRARLCTECRDEQRRASSRANNARRYAKKKEAA